MFDVENAAVLCAASADTYGIQNSEFRSQKTEGGGRRPEEMIQNSGGGGGRTEDSGRETGGRGRVDWGRWTGVGEDGREGPEERGRWAKGRGDFVIESRRTDTVARISVGRRIWWWLFGGRRICGIG